ncbi:sensor histidine kinase [Terriglobus sp. 2YAB30_2]|uniref:sensor histidine kinase n=1 Tax=unclassified Terriglobus TaxID=2628988 RepID=UPI003F99DFA6
MNQGSSITRRLITAVLLLEGLAAVLLIVAVIVNEHQDEYRAFDANLRASANAFLGAVQEAEDSSPNIGLDVRRIPRTPHAVYRVTDGEGHVLGTEGPVPELSIEPDSFRRVKIQGHSYRFFALDGERVVDPGTASAVVHQVHILYGQPDGRVWHEIWEATRFFMVATAILLGVTAILLVWMIRKLLAPIHVLASEADKVNSVHWSFTAPEVAMHLTELRPLASAIERTVNRLQSSFEQQKRFTRDAAHELKTDLAIVKSSLQLLTMKERSVEEYGKGLGIALEDFTRLEETVQQMLTLARLEQPADAVSPTSALHQVLQDNVTQSASFASLNRVTLKASPVATVSVPVDARDAALLCSNLIVNALQHSPDHGTVEIALRSDGTTATLTVRDHGEGITEEDRPHLFEPFYRGDPSRSRKSGGTGLGLSICKAICDRAGGSIEIDNHRAGGAIVTVKLPVSNGQLERGTGRS